MAINFTDSPADGATQVISGRTYTYNSAKNKWDTTATEVVGPTATVYATVDNLPGTATTGDQAFVSGTNRLYIWNGSGWYNIALINTNPTISGVSSSYDLARDGTATVITITATDPEGLPITYSIASDTSGNIATVTQGTGASSNVFTVTPSTSEANAGTFSLTFRASDGVNIASSIASFELAFKVVNSNYTTALITSVGANLADNNDFVDSSTNSHTITAAGNTTQNTFSPYRHGGYSTYFDGTGDYLTASLTTDFNVGTNNFTIEFWGYLNAVGQFNPVLGLGTDSSNGLFVDINSSNNARLLAHIGGSWSAVITGSTALSANQWYHIAVVRNGNDFDIYVDGTKDATTVTNSGSITDPSGGNQVSVGGIQVVSTAWRYFNGYISDLRFVNGSAVYTANFAPPTKRLTAITNTKLLTCHLPYIADGSTSNHSFTVTGNTKTEPFGPYDYLKYASGTHGGSMYFDGTGDYLSAGTSSYNDTLSGDFCIEAWIYPTGTNDGTIIGNYLSGPNRGWSFRSFTSNNLYLYFQIDGGAQIVYQTPSNSVNPNAWNHVVWCRSGTDTSVFINGSRSDNRTLSGTSTGAGGVAISSLSQGFVGYHFTGHITNARIVNGSAVYDPSQTTLTVPTAPLTAITNTSLLISGTNAGIIDKSQSVKTITLNGDVKSSTTQSKYLTSSMYFDGTGDYLEMANDSSLQMGTSPFTIELWMWLGAFQVGGGQEHFVSLGNYTDGIYVRCTSSSFNTWIAGTNTTYSTAPPQSEWAHVAFTRDSLSDCRFFLNGTQIGSTHSNSANITQGGNTRVAAGIHAVEAFTGYLSDVRITKGLARYTANFTPPAAALQG